MSRFFSIGRVWKYFHTFVTIDLLVPFLAFTAGAMVNLGNLRHAPIPVSLSVTIPFFIIFWLMIITAFFWYGRSLQSLGIASRSNQGKGEWSRFDRLVLGFIGGASVAFPLALVVFSREKKDIGSWLVFQGLFVFGFPAYLKLVLVVGRKWFESLGNFVFLIFLPWLGGWVLSEGWPLITWRGFLQPEFFGIVVLFGWLYILADLRRAVFRGERRPGHAAFQAFFHFWPFLMFAGLGWYNIFFAPHQGLLVVLGTALFFLVALEDFVTRWYGQVLPEWMIRYHAYLPLVLSMFLVIAAYSPSRFGMG